MDMNTTGKPDKLDMYLQLAADLGLEDTILSGAPKPNEPISKNINYIKRTIIGSMEGPIRVKDDRENCQYEWNYKVRPCMLLVQIAYIKLMF